MSGGEGGDVGLSSILYCPLTALVTFREISRSPFYMAVVRHGMLSHTEPTEAPPSGPASCHPALIRRWHEAQVQPVRPRLLLDFGRNSSNYSMSRRYWASQVAQW